MGQVPWQGTINFLTLKNHVASEQKHLEKVKFCFEGMAAHTLVHLGMPIALRPLAMTNTKQGDVFSAKNILYFYALMSCSIVSMAERSSKFIPLM